MFCSFDISKERKKFFPLVFLCYIWYYMLFILSLLNLLWITVDTCISLKHVITFIFFKKNSCLNYAKSLMIVGKSNNICKKHDFAMKLNFFIKLHHSFL